MVNFITLYASILHKIMKFAGGLEPRSVEIENAGSTTMNFWVPTNTSPSKPAVVLIHGIAADGILTWQLQVMALTEKYSVYVPNLLFFGGSHTESKERSVRFQAECVVKGLRKLGVERCIVVGISYGGMVGFQMAEHYPELVAGMVVTGTVLAMSESISKERLQKLGLSWWSECLFPTSVEGVKDYFDFISYKPPWLPNFLCKDVLEALSDNREGKLQLLEALVIPDDTVSNHQFQQRIHLLWGEGDKIFPMEIANDLKRRLGDESELIKISKAGHISPLERPCLFNKCLKTLLASLQAEFTIMGKGGVKSMTG